MDRAHNHSFTTSCCSSTLNLRTYYLTEIQQYDFRNLIMKREQTNSQVFSFSFKHLINENQVGGFSTWF